MYRLLQYPLVPFVEGFLLVGGQTFGLFQEYNEGHHGQHLEASEEVKEPNYSQRSI